MEAGPREVSHANKFRALKQKKKQEKKLQKQQKKEQTKRALPLVKRVPQEFFSSSSDSERPRSFESLRPLVSARTMAAIDRLGFTAMREIQSLAIPLLLQGKDLRATAATGSGKTLSFVIPAIERLRRQGFRRDQGLGVLILSPTRELTIQTLDVVKKFLHESSPPSQKQSYGEHVQPQQPEFSNLMIIGQTSMHQQVQQINQGNYNIIVATPGRFLDHLENTPGIKFNDLSCLILDEADRILETGLGLTMQKILNILPTSRQCMLFSATKDEAVESLISNTFRNDFSEVDITANKVTNLNANVVQEYVVCPTYLRFIILYKLLCEKTQSKVMVFLNQCKTVKLFAAMLNASGLEVTCLSGNVPQNQRTLIFSQFQQRSSMVLVCTNVAARGWDVRNVDLIIQVDPPTDAKEFVHRVGRAARDDHAIGRSVLFLRGEELGYVQHLHKEYGVTVRELLMPPASLPDMQMKIYNIVQQDPAFLKMATKCRKLYLTAYRGIHPREYFSEKTLRQYEIDASFGMSPEVPKGVVKDILKMTEELVRRHRVASS